MPVVTVQRCHQITAESAQIFGLGRCYFKKEHDSEPYRPHLYSERFNKSLKCLANTLARNIALLKRGSGYLRSLESVVAYSMIEQRQVSIICLRECVKKRNPELLSEILTQTLCRGSNL